MVKLNKVYDVILHTSLKLCVRIGFVVCWPV